MKIALFGGAFNPPHVCHLLAAVWVKSTSDVDRIWFVPTFRHAFGKPLVDFELRLNMLALALEPFAPFVAVSRVEQELGGESRTIDTLRHLMEKQPEDEFSLVVGADILLEAHKWKQFDQLQQLVPFYVLGRAGLAVSDRKIAIELPDVSSSDIREHLERGDLSYCRPLVPRKVLDFIVEHRLYGTGEPSRLDSPIEGCQK